MSMALPASSKKGKKERKGGGEREREKKERKGGRKEGRKKRRKSCTSAQIDSGGLRHCVPLGSGRELTEAKLYR